MFEGFREETMQFLWGVRLNNQRSWFLEHKAMYEMFLYQPLKELGAEVQEELHRRQPESQFNVHVSRIYRDARRLHGRGPYKDHLWFTLRPPVEQWATVEPVFYFEIYPEGYEYGMGYYCPKPSLMAAYRQHILDNPERMETLAQKLNEQDLFHLEGEEYKRSKGTVSQLLLPLFERDPSSAGRTGSVTEEKTALDVSPERFCAGQVFFSKDAPQLRQEMWMRPLPLGTRSSWPQVGQRKYL